jgi:hypothetical protein
VRFYIKMDPRKLDDDSSAWKPMPLYASAEKDAAGTLYLLVPKSYRGKRYKVVVANNDRERIVSAALLIDGVNSIMRHDGQRYRGVSGYPSGLRKWILSPVGKEFVLDKKGMPGRIEGARLKAVRGPGDSESHVRGFQRGRAAAGSFVFASAAESVAVAELLSVRKIGTISVYFYAEKAPPPEVAKADLKMGVPTGSSSPPRVASSEVGSAPPRPPAPKAGSGKRPPATKSAPPITLGSGAPVPEGGSKPVRKVAPTAPASPDGPKRTVKLTAELPKKSDKPEVELPGTAVGEEVRSGTKRVRVLNWEDNPTAVWHIIYRYEGDPTLPANLKRLP